MIYRNKLLVRLVTVHVGFMFYNMIRLTSSVWGEGYVGKKNGYHLSFVVRIYSDMNYEMTV